MVCDVVALQALEDVEEDVQDTTKRFGMSEMANADLCALLTVRDAEVRSLRGRPNARPNARHSLPANMISAAQMMGGKSGTGGKGAVARPKPRRASFGDNSDGLSDTDSPDDDFDETALMDEGVAPARPTFGGGGAGGGGGDDRATREEMLEVQGSPQVVKLEEKLLAHFEEMSRIWGEDGYIEMRLEMSQAAKTGQSRDDLF